MACFCKPWQHYGAHLSWDAVKDVWSRHFEWLEHFGALAVVAMICKEIEE